VSVVIQSILPQPLTQQVLVKCLNSSSDLVNLFAIRILIVAFQKLRFVLHEYNTALSGGSSQSWQQGSERLVADFCQRCPSMKAIIQVFRRPTFQKDMMREAIVKLIRLYFEVTPQVALQEKFDVSVPLCNALMQAGQPADAPEDKAFRVMELEHWMQIARHSSSMRWWQKSSKFSTSTG
jgi:nucleolar pre-ribosomal-associated protein 1